jgi:hypothetical protein
LCKPRHYLEADTIYIHEIFRLLKKLKWRFGYGDMEEMFGY